MATARTQEKDGIIYIGSANGNAEASRLEWGKQGIGCVNNSF